MSQPNVPDPEGLEPADVEGAEAEEPETRGTELARGEEAENE